MRYLVVNADDFGYSPSVNKGIIEAHARGVVTSTSVLVDSIAADEAALLPQFETLSIGLHFAVKDGDDVPAELTRQVQKFESIVGRKPDHIDTHKRHTTEPGIKEVLLAYAEENEVPIRELGAAKFIDTFFGAHDEGNVSAEAFKSAMDQATDDYNEIMCHVGYSDDYLREHSSYNDAREDELETVCCLEVETYALEQGIKLCNWTQVPALTAR